MCGIAGFTRKKNLGGPERIRSAANSLVHRGPDQQGVFESDVIALAAARLKILDLHAGDQPIVSENKDAVIVFNGEIYNYQDLRRELDARRTCPWRGHSDTETLLSGFDCWGIRGTLERAIGMFALGVWDRADRTLTLARDRVGEKPLYYGWQGRVLLFGSELKALRRHPAFGAPIDRDALALLLRHNYIPAPRSIYQGIRKLEPGTMLSLTIDRCDSVPQPYWSARAAIDAARATPFTGTPDEAVTALETLLKDAIGRQMVADVPLGAFLSGGVDSSTVVALMQAQSSRPVKTFSIGFHEPGFNEAEHAKAVAKHLKTDHTELYVTPAETLAVVPRLPLLYDEPFADSSQIPTFLVSQMARRDVTVSLSGDAGDELFGGYERYRWVDEIWQRARLVPHPLRVAVARAIAAVPSGGWAGVCAMLDAMVPKRFRFAHPEDKLRKLAEILTMRTPEAIYHQLVSHWPSPASVVLGSREPPTIISDPDRWPDLGNLTHEMMYLDLVTYLPDDILVKVDRAAMSVSLETRVPFLDHRVVEFAWRLPIEHKVKNGVGKWVLREVLYRHVPAGLIERPKMGFGVPIDAWLRGPLRDWAESLLDESRLRSEGYFDPAPIRQRWREHLSGIRNWQYHLWDVLMFQAWHEAA